MNRIYANDIFKEGDNVLVKRDGLKYKGKVLGTQGKDVFVDAEYAKVEFINMKYLTKIKESK